MEVKKPGDTPTAPPDYYLGSMNDYQFRVTRRCRRICELTTELRKDLLLVQIDPAIQFEGMSRDKVILAPFFRDDSVLAIRRWPMPVRVAITQEEIHAVSNIDALRLIEIAWAELYPSLEEAEQSVGLFGRGRSDALTEADAKDDSVSTALSESIDQMLPPALYRRLWRNGSLHLFGS